jgi:hypothetical protein
MELEDMVVNLYEEAVEHPDESLAQIKRRMLGRKPWPTKECERASKQMYRLAHMPDPNEIDSN